LLLKKFGSVKKMRSASEKEFIEITGISMRLARSIKLALDTTERKKQGR